MQAEIELKLDLSPDAAEMVAGLPLLHGLESRTAALAATYFDTPDHRLAREGVSLRIRRSGRRRIQTVKANGRGGAGLFARDEWERPVRGRVPVLDEETPVAALLGEAVAAIAPVFDVAVERRTWLVEQDGVVIELVLDRGMVRAGGREQAICEIELELRSGAPGALFALARRIDADIPVRPGVSSKAERGYRLTDVLPSAYKAEPVVLAEGMDIGEAFGRIVALCLRHYRLNEALLLDGYSPDALHQARVAIRRLRTALGLFKPLLRATEVAAFQRELRWLAHVMAPARDLDVLAARIVDPAQRERLEAARAAAQGEVRQWLASARVRALLIDLAAWLAEGAGLGGAGRRPLKPFAEARLRKARRRVVKRGRHIGRLDDEARHRVRKDAKKLRYTAEYFGALFARGKAPRRYKRFIGKLEKMQDVLGALNDLAMAPAILARHGLVVAHDGKEDSVNKATLLARAARAHEDFVDARRFWT